MKVLALLSILFICLLASLFLHTLKKEMLRIHTKEKLTLIQIMLVFLAFIWILVALFK